MFLQQIERKRSKEYLVIILAVKESFERFSCLGFIFEKTVMLKRRPCRLQSADCADHADCADYADWADCADCAD